MTPPLPPCYAHLFQNFLRRSSQQCSRSVSSISSPSAPVATAAGANSNRRNHDIIVSARRPPLGGPRPRHVATHCYSTGPAWKPIMTSASQHYLQRTSDRCQSLPHQQRQDRYFSSSSGGDSSHPFVLSHPAEVDHSSDKTPSRGRIICITSGKGGVGKTTSAASFATGLARRGHPTCVVDFDIGLRNLDIHLGVERRVIFDFVHVLQGECTLSQALIADKKVEGLSMLAASQTRDKDALTMEGVEGVLKELSERFDYVVLDSPAGIESGARHAMYFCDDAIVVTNPELSSCRDADKMIGFVSSRSRRAEIGHSACSPVSQTLLITRYDPVRAEAEESLAIEDMKDLLGLPVIGVVPESKDVLTCTNLGKPIIAMGEDHPAAGAYMDMVDRFLGQEKELRFVTPEPVSFFKRIFG